MVAIFFALFEPAQHRSAKRVRDVSRSAPGGGFLELESSLVASAAAGHLYATIDRRAGPGLPDLDGGGKHRAQLRIAVLSDSGLHGTVGGPFLLETIQDAINAFPHGAALRSRDCLHVDSSRLLSLSEHRRHHESGDGESGKGGDLGKAEIHVSVSLVVCGSFGSLLGRTASVWPDHVSSVLRRLFRPAERHAELRRGADFRKGTP